MVGHTGLGSWPGEDYAEALRITFDLVPALPYLPELPTRGPWAAMVGRGCGLLEGLGASLDAGQWRLSPLPGIDQRRARTTWRDDLDRLEELAEGYRGQFKVAIIGPVSLAAWVLRPLGGRVLADPGARRDVAQALAQGVSDLLAGLTRRLPGAELVLQVDEPLLPAALAGGVPSEAGYFRVAELGADEGSAMLAPLARLTDRSLVHCCSSGAPIALLTTDPVGFTGIALDQDLVPDWDAIAAAVEGGASLHLGCQPTAPGSPPWSADALARRALDVLRPLELGDRLADALWLTPACGLAGFAPREAVAVLRNLGRAAEQVAAELAS